MNKILLIGCGHMGNSLLEAWIKEKNNSFIIIDPKNYKKINIKYKKKVKAFRFFKDIKIITKFNIVIFAVKPQSIIGVMEKISFNNFSSSTLFLSIIAGKKISFFEKYLQIKSQIVRIMPNMPALVQEGMTCSVSNRYVTKLNKSKTDNLLRGIGKNIWFSDEKFLDLATAISGSGPGYFFLFIYFLESVAIEMGFSKKIAKQLVQQTAYGSIKLLLNSSATAEELSKKIAVKGGTTEAALDVLENKNKFKNIIKKAIYAAHKKSIQLGKD